MRGAEGRVARVRGTAVRGDERMVAGCTALKCIYCLFILDVRYLPELRSHQLNCV